MHLPFTSSWVSFQLNPSTQKCYQFLSLCFRQTSQDEPHFAQLFRLELRIARCPDFAGCSWGSSSVSCSSCLEGSIFVRHRNIFYLFSVLATGKQEAQSLLDDLLTHRVLTSHFEFSSSDWNWLLPFRGSRSSSYLSAIVSLNLVLFTLIIECWWYFNRLALGRDPY